MTAPLVARRRTRRFQGGFLIWIGVFIGAGIALHRVPVQLLLTATALFAVFAGAQLWPVGIFVCALLLAWLPLPAYVHLGTTVAGIGFLLTDILFFAAAAQSCWLRSTSETPARRRADLPFSFFAASVAGMMALGLLRGVPPGALVLDARGPLYMLAAYIVVTRLYAPDMIEKGERFVVGIVSAALGIIALSAMVGTKLQGRAEDLTSALANQNIDVSATRILTSTTHVALALACYLVALHISGFRRNELRIWVGGASSIVIILLAFSRNAVLAFVIASMFAVLAGTASGKIGRVVRLAAVGTVVVVFVLLVSSVFSNIPGMPFVNRSLVGYQERVVGGLVTGGERDTSYAYRLAENRYARKAWETSPIIGNGFGWAYHPPFDRGGTWAAVQGVYYAHNLYWWVLIKGGGAALMALLVFLLSPVRRALAAKRSGPDGAKVVALVATLLGFMAVSFVAPMVLDRAAAPLLGAIAGYLSAHGALRSETSVSTRLSHSPG